MTNTGYAERIGVLPRHSELLAYRVAFGLQDGHFPALDITADTRIILASQNRGRIGTMKQYMPLNQVRGRGVDPEPLTKDTRKVALHKTGEAHRLEPHYFGTSVVIGTDTLTEILTTGPDGQVIYETVGQPESLLTTLSTNFYKMYNISTAHGVPLEYRVRSHSVLLHRNRDLILFEDGQEINVSLNRLVAQHLATNKGLVDYILAFQYVYKGLIDPKFQLHKISGGIDLLALVYMGAVDAINGIPREDPRFEQVLQFATFIVTVGFSPKILRLLGISEEEIIPQESFIPVITQRALKNDRYWI